MTLKSLQCFDGEEYNFGASFGRTCHQFSSPTKPKPFPKRAELDFLAGYLAAKATTVQATPPSVSVKLGHASPICMGSSMEVFSALNLD